MNIVYKSCHPYIVTLQKLRDTITNEERQDIFDSFNAKYRANKLKVISIKHKLTNEEINSVETTYYEYKKLKYIKDTIVVEKNFNDDLKDPYGEGIYYYKNREIAYFLEIEKFNNYTGICKLWHTNGKLYWQCNYKTGKLDGMERQWYENGILDFICHHIDNIPNGLFQKWYESG